MNVIQRLRYFTSQFLVETDFQDEQSYHRNMRLLHNKSFHTFGVVGDGLIVTKVGDRQIKVSAGMALDKNGQEIVLLSDSDAVALNGVNTDVFVTLQYAESPDVPDTTSGLTDQFGRTTEKFQIASSTTKPPADGSVIQLARVTLDKNGNIAQINTQERILAGAKIAPKSVGTDQLADDSVTAAKIVDGSVGTAELVDSSVTAAKIVDGSVGTAELTQEAVTADKIAQSAFVVRTASFSTSATGLRLSKDPSNVAAINITVPSKGAVIFTASGAYISIQVPNATPAPSILPFINYRFGLQEANRTDIPDDAINIFIQAPGTRVSGPFSITKAFSVLNAGTQTYNLVSSFSSSDPATTDKGSALFRLTLTAMFVPCSGVLTE